MFTIMTIISSGYVACWVYKRSKKPVRPAIQINRYHGAMTDQGKVIEVEFRRL